MFIILILSNLWIHCDLAALSLTHFWLLAGLAYLQFQDITKINWDKLELVSHGALSTLANTTTQISNSVIGYDHASPTTMAISANFGIPLTGSMATGFAIGFMKG
jgi:uncharacterized membrane protein (Fun14 family)